MKLAAKAEASGKYNVAFEAYFLLSKVDNCLEVLIRAKRMAEAAIFARAYAPSRLAEMIPYWGQQLKDQDYPFQPDDVTKTAAEQLNSEI